MSFITAKQAKARSMQIRKAAASNAVAVLKNDLQKAVEYAVAAGSDYAKVAAQPEALLAIEDTLLGFQRLGYRAELYGGFGANQYVLISWEDV